MFSGLIKGIGRVATRTDHGKDRRFVIELGSAAIAPLRVGGSVAVNGVCLTAIAVAADRFTADVSAETLAVTTFGGLAADAKVNLEPPLNAGDPLDGHIVTGHVDGVGEVVAIEAAGRSTRLVIEVPTALSRYIAAKGSVAVDGVSLTVNRVRGTTFEVNLIPHTLKATTLRRLARGARVNLEVDLVARYVARLLEARSFGEST